LSERRLRVLLVAYACEPGRGSEPGAGWNSAVSLASYCSVWVLTRENNRGAIESELQRNPVEHLHFVYFDLPPWTRFWKRGQRGVQLYSYLWQAAAAKIARDIVQREGIDVAQHVTFVKYWAPSAVRSTGVPYIWGPVGGGEPLPRAFWTHLSWRGLVYEVSRLIAQRIAETDPLVRATARRAAIALATTPETARRLERIGARRVEIMNDVALTPSEIRTLATVRRRSPHNRVRFLGVGRLLAWKGYDLVIRALAQSSIPDWELTLVGEGPERSRLLRLASKLGVSNRVNLVGRVDRERLLRWFAWADVFVHPSLHETGGWAVVEAMAAGLPVVGCNAGGTAQAVTEECGILAGIESFDTCISEFVAACESLSADLVTRMSMASASRCRAMDVYAATRRARRMHTLLREIVDDQS